MIHKLVVLFGLMSLLAGCSSTPKVTYSVFQPNSTAGGWARSPDYQGKMKFNMVGSLLLLESGPQPAPKPKPKAGNAPKGGEPKEAVSTAGVAPEHQAAAAPTTSAASYLDDVSVKVTKNDSSKSVILVNPHDPLGVKTNYTITYYDNTAVVKSIGTDLQDKRVEYIKNVGSFLAATAPIAGTLLLAEHEFPPPINLPVTIDVESYRDDRGLGKVAWQPLGFKNQDYYEFKIDLQAPSATSVGSDDFFSKFGKEATNVFPVPSCRDAVLSVRLKCDNAPDGACTTADVDASTKEFHFKISDPRYLETVSLPVKGSIDMMDICGANLTQGNASTENGWQIVGEIFTQANAVKKAYTDATKKAGK